MENNYNNKNARIVLGEVENLMNYGRSFDFREKLGDGRTVYDVLSIFDWWPNRLNQNHLKQMKTFLREAIKLGYTGYVCFKVGASGCANGMWAHKKPSTNGYSPDGDCIYRSFTPDYTYYSVNKNNKWYPSEETDGNPYDSCKRIPQLEQLIISLN